MRQGDGASFAVTITIASLAADASMLAGRQSDAVDNSSTMYRDYLLSGYLVHGGTTSGRLCEIWAIGCVNDAILWPDAFGTSDANRSVNSRAQLLNYGRRLWSAPTNTGTFYVQPTSIAGAFGGFLPKKFVLWFVTGIGTMSATGSDHVLTLSPRYQTS